MCFNHFNMRNFNMILHIHDMHNHYFTYFSLSITSLKVAE